MFYGIGKVNKKTISRVEIGGFDISLASPVSVEDAEKIRLAVLRRLTGDILQVPLSDGCTMTVTFILH